MASGITSCYGVAENLGLFRISSDLKKCKIYNRENRDLLSNAVIQIQKYDDFLWVLTKRGISKYNLIKDNWNHYRVDNNAVVVSTSVIKCTPHSEWNIGIVNKNDKVEVIGLVCGSGWGYCLIRLNKQVIGWANGFPNDYYKGKGETTSEYVYSEPNDKSIPASSFQGAMQYKVTEEDKKDGWYRIIIDKGIVPTNILKFKMIKVNKLSN